MVNNTHHPNPSTGENGPLPMDTNHATVNPTNIFRTRIDNGQLRLIAFSDQESAELWLTHRQAKALASILTDLTNTKWTTDEETEC